MQTHNAQGAPAHLFVVPVPKGGDLEAVRPRLLLRGEGAEEGEEARQGAGLAIDLRCVSPAYGCSFEDVLRHSKPAWVSLPWTAHCDGSHVGHAFS